MVKSFCIFAIMGTLSQRKVNLDGGDSIARTVNTTSAGARPKIVQKLPGSTGSKSADQRRKNGLTVPVLPSKKSHTTLSSANSRRPASGKKSANRNNHAKRETNEDEGQDVMFTNVPSMRENMQNEQAAKEEIKHSTEKRIQPEEVLEKSQETNVCDVFVIDLSGDHIIKIENLEKFTQVKVLDLSSNYIRRIENLETLPDLRDLKLYNNQIEIIQNLDKLSELCTLRLQQNKIKQIGKGLHTLRKLKVLRLDCNFLHKLEVRELASLSQLASLDISGNMLEDISPVTTLPRLEELYAENNRLRTVADLSRCKHLSEVDVSHNRITDLSGLKSLHKLTVLHASHNLLTSNHMKVLCKLKNLEELHISNNKITDLHTWVPQHPVLEILDVKDNKVHTWKTVCELRNVPELVELYLAGNPFCAEKGEKPLYFLELQTVIPQLHVIDGAHTKTSTSNTSLNKRPTTPLMRPMSASSAVSSRQMENQLLMLQSQIEQSKLQMEKNFSELRNSFGVLPAESVFDSRPSSVMSVNSTRPSSRCSQRSRIQDALSFAQQEDQLKVLEEQQKQKEPGKQQDKQQDQKQKDQTQLVEQPKVKQQEQPDQEPQDDQTERTTTTERESQSATRRATKTMLDKGT